MKTTGIITISLLIVAGLGLSAVVACPLCPKKDSAQNVETSNPEHAVKESSDASFNDDVIASTKPVLVDFYATWCGPCKKMGPVVENLSKEYGDKIAVWKVNVDRNPSLSSEYRIQSIPAIKLFRNGKVVDEALGLTPASELRSKIDKAISR